MRVRGLEEIKPLNRKLVLGLFVTTGIASGLLWWRGNNRSELKLEIFNPVVETRIVISPTIKPNGLQKIVEQRVATQSGTYGVYVYNLKTSTGWGVNDNQSFPGASILKVPAMLKAIELVEKGEMKMDQMFVVSEQMRASGSGPLQYLTNGTKISLARILSEMGKSSDNTGWRILNQTIGSNVVQQKIRDLGMKNTDYSELTTTARDVATLFIEVNKNPQIQKYLQESIYEDRIAKGLPESIVLIHKVGTDVGVWADAGIISCANLPINSCRNEPMVLVILNDKIKRVEAEKFVPGLTKLIWQFWNEQGQ